MLFIKNGHIKTMAGADIENGCVLIGDDGKIAAVGADLALPEGATVIDAGGKLVTPGCVEAHCHIGLHSAAVRWEGADYNESSNPITPHMRAIDGIDPFDEYLQTAVEHGITTACTGPGSANVVGGTFAAIKLVGKRVDKMIVK
ncbi:MAG: amidohydrolase, partial [Clostridia bacterium]|nr:amidohydrolase [Clostridia bacterium]